MTASPIPQGRYLPAKRFGDVVFTAGMTPRRKGVLVSTGAVRADQPLELQKEAVQLAAANALAAARSLASDDETVAEILSMTVFIAAGPGFEAHAKIADFASNYLSEELGEAGIGARAAVGVASLPGNASIEIALIAGIRKVVPATQGE